MRRAPGSPPRPARRHSSGALTIAVAIALATGLASAARADRPADSLGVDQPADSLDSIRALLLQGHYGDAEDAARRQLAREHTQANPDSMRLAETMDVLIEALWRGGKPGAPELRSLAAEAMAIKTRRRGAEDLSVSATLLQLGIALRRTGQYDSALVCFSRALAIRERALGANHLDVVLVLNSLGNLQRERGELAAAESTFRRVLAIREQALGRDSPQVAQALKNLGAVLVDAGRPGEAGLLFERCLEIEQRALDPEHPELALTLENLAGIANAAGDRPKAQELYRRVLALREKRLGPDHPEVARALDNLGLSLLDDLRFDESRALLERARLIRETKLGPDHPLVGTSLDNLGRLEYEVGDYPRSRPLYERALAIREHALGPDHAEVAASLNNLGRLLAALGDFATAQRYAERALAIDERRLGPRHPYVAINLSNLARVLDAEGHRREALARIRRAIAIRAANAEAEKPDPDVLLLASILSDLGRNREADSLLRSSLARAEHSFGERDPRVAPFLENLGVYELRQGRTSESTRHLERAVAVSEPVLGPEHRDVLYALHELARSRWAAADTLGALRTALRAEAQSRASLRRDFLLLPQRQALVHAAGVMSGYDLSLQLATLGLRDSARHEVFDAVIRSRALVLDAMVTRRALLAGTTDSASATLLEHYRAAATRLGAMMVRGAGSSAGAPIERQREQARVEAETAERALAERSVALRSQLDRDRVGIDAVEAALPERSALVAFAKFAYWTPARQVGRQGSSRIRPSSRQEFLAFVLHRGDTAPVAIRLGSAAVVERLITNWQREVARAPGDARHGDSIYRTVGTALRRAVWDPLEREIGDVDRVLIVPDGSLGLVSFATLPTGLGRFLVQAAPAIHYLSTERDLVGRAGTPRSTGGMLAIGDPAFDALTAPTVRAPGPGSSVPHAAASLRGEALECPDFAAVRFRPLPATRLEAREVANLWRARSTPQSPGESSRSPESVIPPFGDVLELTGAQATESAFKTIAPGRSAIHVATHGFFIGGTCSSHAGVDRGIGALVSDGPPGPSSVTTRWADQNPDVAAREASALAGLAFAGANRRSAAPPDADDGILTAEEVATLDLSAVQWAVLSACETGTGNVQPSEGVLGMRRAFRIAGARTLITSLWAVQDEATLQWMRSLYRARYVSGVETDGAVRQACLDVLNDRMRRGLSTHPFYWGAFVAAGDWN